MSFEAATTLERPPLPPLLRAANLVGGALRRAGFVPVSLDERDLLETAIRQTGYSDWGPEPFLPGLRTLIDAFETQARLSFLGRVHVRRFILQQLTSRLRVQARLRSHPDIEALSIDRPLFIAGFPRTGTTLLHNLLAQAPGARAPRFFELLSPATPSRRGLVRHDPRVRKARRMVRQSHRFAPEIQRIHPLTADGPEECVFLFQRSFASHAYHVMADVPAFTEWLLRQDMVPYYRFHRRQIQLMQSEGAGNPWVLKSPFHLFSLDALLEVYPDACIIQTHRDPAELLASWCSMVEAFHSMTMRRFDRAAIGRSWLDLWAEGLDRMLEVRRTAPADRFYDIHYRELLEEPASAIRGMYRHFGLEGYDGLENDVADWLRANPAGKHGAHRYNLERYGLSREQVRERFAAYLERFDL